MPSYLYQDVPVQVQPYQAPLELYAQAVATKDAKVKAQLSNIRNYYDTILNTPLTNSQNQQTLRAGVQTAMDKLSKSAVSDLSLPENVSSIEGVFDPIINDRNIIYDAAWTRNHRRELSKAEDLQKTKPELVPPQNLEPLYLAQRNYEQSDPGSRPGFTAFTPYYDFNSKVNLDLDKVKADVDNQIVQGKGIKITGADGSVVDIDNISQQQLTQIKESKVAEIVWNKLHTDAQALNQMSLDFNFNSNHGMYSPSQAGSDIDTDISSIKSQVEYFNMGAKSGNLSQSLADAKMKGLNERITQLTDLKNGIKIDPSRAKEYYTFNKSIKDYVEGKVSQYSYKDEGKLEDVPFYAKFRDYQYDVLKEGWKAKFEADKAAKAAAAKLKAIPGITQGVTPLKDIVLSLEESPTGKITAPETDIQAMGNFTSKDGKLYHSFAQSGSSPSDMLIIQPATHDLTESQTKALNQAQVMYGLNRDLEAIGIKVDADYTYAPGYGESYGGAPLTDTTYPTGEDILKNIATNPNFYGKDTEKITRIVAKYSDLMSKLKIDIKDPKSLMQIQSAIKDPAVAKARAIGETINQLNGDFQVALEGDNVVKGESGLMYVKGKVIVPVSHLGNKGLPSASDLMGAGIATLWTPGVSSGRDSDDEGKYVKTNEPQVAINFYKPVNGDMADINDRMLENSKRLEGQGDNTFPIREASRASMKNFYNTLQQSDNFQFKDLTFVKKDDGNYTLSQSAFNNKPLLDNINRMAWDISVRTGTDPKKVQQDVTNILAANTLPVRRAEALSNYEQNLINQPSNITSLDVSSFMQGISGPEGADYNIGNKQSSAFGKYQITDSAYNKIKYLPGFPDVYKLEDFSDFKKNPALQETTMAVYSSYLLDKFKNPITAAVAFYTGEASEETKAFQLNPDAALAAYQNRKPSTGGSNDNSTIGAYIKKFLRSYSK